MAVEFKEVNQSLGQSIRVGSFSASQYIAAGLPAGVIFFILNGIFGINILFTIFITLWIGATCAVLSGDKPYQFWSKLWPVVPYWVRGYVMYDSPLRKKKYFPK